PAAMKAITDWLKQNHDNLVNDLAKLVAVRSVSTDGEHQKEIQQSAELVAAQMRQAGLQSVEVLKTDDSNPYAYGEWLGAPGTPTGLRYSHHGVPPAHQKARDGRKGKPPPGELPRGGDRLYGRGSADDKGAITAHLGAIASFLKTTGGLPVNVKVLVEGE